MEETQHLDNEEEDKLAEEEVMADHVEDLPAPTEKEDSEKPTVKEDIKKTNDFAEIVEGDVEYVDF